MINIGNPFIECTSRDMKYEEVNLYWCNPFECFRINERVLLQSHTPVFLEGPRGAGKTMILKYISYFCQKEKYKDSIKSIGIYFRYKEDFGVLFQGIECSSQRKHDIFHCYFQLYILNELFRILSDVSKSGIDSVLSWKNLVRTLNDVFNTNLDEISAFSQLVKNRTREIDKWIRISKYKVNRDDELEQILNYGIDVVDVCNLVSRAIPSLEDALFIIIIDEYENASKYQVDLNTLIKQVDNTANVTYRIGYRPNGIRTLMTNVGNEFLQEGRDFLRYSLTFKEMTSYKKFVSEVANKRLEREVFYKDLNLVNIEAILGLRESLDREAYRVVKGRKKHFEILRKVFDRDSFDKEIEKIRNPDNPLMEMLNILWVLRGETCDRTRIAMEGYLKHYNNTTKEVNDYIHLIKKYALDYRNKYRYQLMFEMLGIYGKKKQYYSFNTFCYLSSGGINDFISLCRNVFYLLDESYFENCMTDPMIPSEVQSKGAEITANEQLEIVRLCGENGFEMFTFSMNMGELFNLFHKDQYAKYPETNQFAFANEIQIDSSADLRSVKDSMIRWGVIVKKNRMQRISIGRRKGTLYYLNRIFCPVFNISFRTRGGYNFIIPASLFNKMINDSMDAEQIKAWKEKESQESTRHDSSIDPNQLVIKGY